MPWVSRQELIEYIRTRTPHLTIAILEHEMKKFQKRKKEDHKDRVVFGLYSDDSMITEWEYLITDI